MKIMGKKLLHKYKNGNYWVELYEDGTKVRYTEEDEFISQFPENIDIKVTNYCDAGCAWCHEGSTVKGKYGHIDYKFLDTLRPGTELAIGGGNPLSWDLLVPFLEKMKEKGIICNITINQLHFMRDGGLVDELVKRDLVKGIGVSFMSYSDDLVEKLKRYEHVVLHVINGVVSLNQLRKLYGHGLKLLILGYKYLRRGEEYYSESVERRKKELYDNIHEVLRGFKIVSFDNLGIKQLNVKRFMLKEEWEERYMGDDGKFTMYIDLVEGEFAKSSTSLKRYKIMDCIDDMFEVVKNE